MSENEQKRPEPYCCPAMRSAVGKWGFLKDRVRFMMVRGEHPGWRFGKSSLILFCPWCGKKLPDRQFTEDK